MFHISHLKTHVAILNLFYCLIFFLLYNKNNCRLFLGSNDDMIAPINNFVKDFRSFSTKFDDFLYFFSELATQIKSNNSIKVKIEGNFNNHSIIASDSSVISNSIVNSSDSLVDKIHKQIISQEEKIEVCQNEIKQLKEIVLGILTIQTFLNIMLIFFLITK